MTDEACPPTGIATLGLHRIEDYAMWKGAAVIGGNVPGIRRQITDGENGFLVDTVEQTAERIVELLQDPALRQKIGAAARETVRENFLLSRLTEDWIDLLGAQVDPDMA